MQLKRKDEKETEFDDLCSMKAIMENKAFQKYIVGGMREYQKELANAYDCDSLKELATLKGKKHGSEELFRILKTINVDHKNLYNELKDTD